MGSSRLILVGLATLTGSSRLILVGLATLTGSSRLILVGLATLTGSSRLILFGLGNQKKLVPPGKYVPLSLLMDYALLRRSGTERKGLLTLFLEVVCIAHGIILHNQCSRQNQCRAKTRSHYP